jgi:SAM-dependent methyltransferase
MQSYTRKDLLRAETHAREGAMDLVWSELRHLCLDDFGEFFLSLPNPEYPELSRALPAMASAEVQRNWTGNDGYALLRQTLNFVRSVRYSLSLLTGQRLEGAKIMDFGCGYGRIARLMYYFTNPTNLFCVDPWDESIRLCRESRMLGNFFVSDYLPVSLPFSENRFDLIYCFSVFTHLSSRATRAALNTLRRYISPGGLLVITIRPEEYWLSAKIDCSANRTADDVLAEHRKTGFAFVPHRRLPIDGDITYGDTSLTFDWLSREFPTWQIVGHDRSLDDPFQILVFLTPKS